MGSLFRSGTLSNPGDILIMEENEEITRQILDSELYSDLVCINSQIKSAKPVKSLMGILYGPVFGRSVAQMHTASL